MVGFFFGGGLNSKGRGQAYTYKEFCVSKLIFRFMLKMAGMASEN